MSKYTMQLREIYSPTLQFKNPFYTKLDVIGWFENYELTDYLTTEEINVINTRGVWNKHKLATKIVNHYMMREIGFETMGLFRNRVKVFMNELMEEYLPLIYSASIEYDPLVNVDYTEEYTREATNEGSNSNSSSGTNNTNTTNGGTNTISKTLSGTNTGSVTLNKTDTISSTNSGLVVESDTPQGQITKSSILGGSYASHTTANENTNGSTDTIASTEASSNTSSETESESDTFSSSGTITNNTSSSETGTNENILNEEYTKRVKGNSGVSATSQKMIQQYRDNIRAIDREIIEKCNVLFMGIY